MDVSGMGRHVRMEHEVDLHPAHLSWLFRSQSTTGSAIPSSTGSRGLGLFMLRQDVLIRQRHPLQHRLEGAPVMDVSEPVDR